MKHVFLLLTLQLVQLQVQGTKPSFFSRLSELKNTKAIMVNSTGNVQKVLSKQMQEHATQDTKSYIRLIISRLNDLIKAEKAITVNSTGTDLKVPSPQMQQHAKCCVAVFKGIFWTMLKSVTVSEEMQHYVGEILNLLDDLPLPQQVSERCTEQTQICSPNKLNPTSMTPFSQYTRYLHQLNKQL